MAEQRENSNKKITVYGVNGEVVLEYTGRFKVFFDDKATMGCIHFIDEQGMHHRIFGESLCEVKEI